MFIGNCMLQFHLRVCEATISICNQWEFEEFKTTLQAFSLLYFLYKPINQKNPLHLNVSRSEQKKNISTLKYTFPIQIGFINFLFFCCLNSLFQVEVFEAIQHILTSCSRWKFQSKLMY